MANEITKSNTLSSFIECDKNEAAAGDAEVFTKTSLKRHVYSCNVI